MSFQDDYNQALSSSSVQAIINAQSLEELRDILNDDLDVGSGDPDTEGHTENVEIVFWKEDVHGLMDKELIPVFAKTPRELVSTKRFHSDWIVSYDRTRCLVWSDYDARYIIVDRNLLDEIETAVWEFFCQEETCPWDDFVHAELGLEEIDEDTYEVKWSYTKRVLRQVIEDGIEVESDYVARSYEVTYEVEFDSNDVWVVSYPVDADLVYKEDFESGRYVPCW